MDKRTSLTLIASLSLLYGCGEQMFATEDDPTEIAMAESPALQTEQENPSYLTTISHLPSASYIPDYMDDSAIMLALEEHQSAFYYVLNACVENDVPAEVALIPFLTTHYNNAYAYNGKTGIWQLSPGQAQNLSLTNNYWFDGRRDLVQSTEATIDYVKFLHSQLNQDWTLVLAAMHTGFQNMYDALESNRAQGLPLDLNSLDISPTATQFIEDIQSVAYLIEDEITANDHPVSIVEFPGQIALDSLARTSKVSLSSIQELNAGFKRPLTDPDGPHRILTSNDNYKNILDAANAPSQLREVSKSNWDQYIVKPNQSLSVIAHDFGTTVSEIKRVNHLHSDIIRVNQKLIIPEKHTSAPQPTQKVEPVAGPKRIEHTVARKETLYGVSTKYNVSIEHIKSWNQHVSSNIHAGQKIKIWKFTPTSSARFYTVQPNDSLSKIARLHGVSVQSLKDANQLKSNVIYPNSRLVIPKKS